MKKGACSRRNLGAFRQNRPGRKSVTKRGVIEQACTGWEGGTGGTEGKGELQLKGPRAERRLPYGGGGPLMRRGCVARRPRSEKCKDSDKGQPCHEGELDREPGLKRGKLSRPLV